MCSKYVGHPSCSPLMVVVRAQNSWDPGIAICVPACTQVFLFKHLPTHPMYARQVRYRKRTSSFASCLTVTNSNRSGSSNSSRRMGRQEREVGRAWTGAAARVGSVQQRRRGSAAGSQRRRRAAAGVKAAGRRVWCGRCVPLQRTWARHWRPGRPEVDPGLHLGHLD